MALLAVHSQIFSSLRKNSFKRACRRVVHSQVPVSYGGQPLTPQLLRSAGNGPTAHQACGHGKLPSRHAGQQCRPVRVLSWNAGHLGRQQWAEIKTYWPQGEAQKFCEVLPAQETHWKEPAASAPGSRAGQARSGGKDRKQSEGKQSKPPSTTAADELKVLFSPDSINLGYAGRNGKRDACWKSVHAGQEPDWPFWPCINTYGRPSRPCATTAATGPPSCLP